jgi:hypothetical protein
VEALAYPREELRAGHEPVPVGADQPGHHITGEIPGGREVRRPPGERLRAVDEGVVQVEERQRSHGG